MRKRSKVSLSTLIVSVAIFASVAFFVSPATCQKDDCDGIPKQINDLIDKLPEGGTRIGEESEKLDHANQEIQSATVESTRQKWIEARNSWQHAIESNRSQIRSIKVKIDNLITKLSACCSNKQDTGMAQRDQDCKAIPKQLNDLADKLPEVGTRIGEESEKLDHANQEIQSATVESTRQKWIEARNSWQHAIESNRSQIRSIKVKIDNLITKLLACCDKNPNDTTKASPSTTKSTTKGAVDSCLVGTWRSESIAYQWRKEPGSQFPQFGGGSGIVMTIEANGRITVDYNQMQTLEYVQSEGGHRYRERWKGSCTGKLSFIDVNRRAIAVEEQRCGLGYEGSHTDSSGTVYPLDSAWSGFGPVGATLTGRTLTCDQTTLTASEDNPGPSSLTITFKRTGKEP